MPLPSYDDLPVRAGAPPRSSWGVWGDDDRLGCLNLLTPERVVRAAATVRTGKVFALNLDVTLPDPPLFHRAAPVHEVTGDDDATSHDDILTFNTQSSSQWDGFRHVRSQWGHYNGVADREHGIDHWAARGIVGRGVLVDVGRWRAAVDRPVRYDQPDPIEPDDVQAAAAAQGVALEEGDILLLRTGWLSWYRSLDGEERTSLAQNLACPGLRPGPATARFLWDLHIAAIAADNPAVEVWPPGSLLDDETRERLRGDPEAATHLFVHLSLLPLLGLPLGELWDLDALADDCAADGVYECLLTSAPLHVPAGVASPPNALALK